MQNNPPVSGSMVESATPQPFAPAAPGSTPLNTGAPLTSKDTPAPKEKKSHNTIIETILLILVSIVAVIFVWLYIQKYIEWDTISTDVEGRIDAAVAMAVAENTTKMEAEFAEREKYPYKDFVGPADYGSVSFQYPQTWSVYIARDAINGGDFEAYFNPVEVEPVGPQTINALRFTIKDTAFDTVTRNYEGYIKNGKLTLETRSVGGVLANLYTGELPNGIHGAMVMLRVRDKTVMLQTDAEIFISEFYKLLETVNLIQ